MAVAVGADEVEVGRVEAGAPHGTLAVADFQSMGKVAGSFILSISRQGIIFLIVLAVAYYTAGYMGIVVSQAIADTITAIIAVILFRKQLYKEFH